MIEVRQGDAAQPARAALSTRLRIVNCAEIADPDWTFLEAPLRDLPVDWSFFHAREPSSHSGGRHSMGLARLRATWSAARCAAGNSGAVVISHLPKTTMWLAIFCRLLSVRATHIAFAFNFTRLPTGFYRTLMRWAFKGVDRFVVFSTAERACYAAYFGIDAHRIDFMPWEMPPPTSEGPPIVTGPYICAVGGEGRDYGTLIEAVRHTPDIPLVIVTRSYSIPHGTLPDNVTLFTELRSSDYWNVVQHAHFAVLPLLDDQTNCGHITLVGALLLERPIIASRSVGIDDYVQANVNALIVNPGAPEALRVAIRRLWDEPALRQRLHQTISAAKRESGGESRWAEYFRHLFKESLNSASKEPARLNK